MTRRIAFAKLTSVESVLEHEHDLARWAAPSYERTAFADVAYGSHPRATPAHTRDAGRADLAEASRPARTT